MLSMKYLIAALCLSIVLLSNNALADGENAAARNSQSAIKIESAILKAIDSTVVSAQSSGVLADIKVKEGSKVQPGDLMARIRDDAIRLKLDQQNTQMLIARKKQENTIDKEVAQKSREVAETEFQRALAANKRVANTYPLNEIDRLKLVAQRSKLEVDRAEYEIEMAALDYAIATSDYKQTAELLERHSIKSPVAGTVVSVDKHLGEWVEPGTEIFRIVRTDTLRIEGFIPAVSDNGRLVGSTVLFKLSNANDQREYKGKLVFVSPEVNPVNSLVRVFAEATNVDGTLRPGPAVQASIASEIELSQIQSDK